MLLKNFIAYELFNSINSKCILYVCYSDDQGLVYKDAIFISTHKFVGGVETPGRQTLHVIKSVTDEKR